MKYELYRLPEGDEHADFEHAVLVGDCIGSMENYHVVECLTIMARADAISQIGDIDERVTCEAGSPFPIGVGREEFYQFEIYAYKKTDGKLDKLFYYGVVEI